MKLGDNIVISGLTAAGKTTHSRLLAAFLDYEYVSATELVMAIAGIKNTTTDRVWFRGDAKVRKALTSIETAKELTRQLTELAASKRHVVFDSWGLAWAFDGPLVKIWIESDRLSRSWKCYVSQGAAPTLSVVECKQLMDEKDLATRKTFSQEYGIDIFADRDVFDIVVDNSWLIRAPTRDAADAGILRFDETLRKVFSQLLHGQPLDDLVGRESSSPDIGYEGVQVRAIR